VVATKLAEGRCEKENLTYVYFKIIIELQTMLFKLNISKVLTLALALKLWYFHAALKVVT